MVALTDVTASNARIASTFPNGLTAVFVGGTSGVGEYTVKALARYAMKPRIYIVGRSQEAADRIIQECQQLNPSGTFTFLQSDISILKNVDETCRAIKSKETAINILFQSQGSMAYSKVTPDGLPHASALYTHSRLRFTLSLLPLLQSASSLRRVVSVGAATYEGPIDTSNMLAQRLPLLKWRDQMASINTILLQQVSQRAPDVSFVHAVPGVVQSGILRDVEAGWRMAVTLAVAKALAPLVRTPPEVCAERQLFLATSARFRDGLGEGVDGVALEGGVVVARGCDGRVGSGVYSVDDTGESAAARIEELLAGYQRDGTARRVWDFVVADLVRVTGGEVGL